MSSVSVSSQVRAARFAPPGNFPGFHRGMCGETGSGADQIPLGKRTILGTRESRDAGEAPGRQTSGRLRVPGLDLHFGFHKTRYYLRENRLWTFFPLLLWRPQTLPKVENAGIKLGSGDARGRVCLPW